MQASMHFCISPLIFPPLFSVFPRTWPRLLRGPGFMTLTWPYSPARASELPPVVAFRMVTHYFAVAPMVRFRAFPPESSGPHAGDPPDSYGFGGARGPADIPPAGLLHN